MRQQYRSSRCSRTDLFEQSDHDRCAYAFGGASSAVGRQVTKTLLKELYRHALFA